MRRRYVLALLTLATSLALPLHKARAADQPRDPLVLLIDSIAAGQDPRVAAVLPQIKGTDRQLLALRAYLRAGPDLAQRWSWTTAQIATFAHSPENAALQKEIRGVQQAFSNANPGFTLWVNPEVRSLDTQLANWNRNESVALAAADMQVAMREWLQSTAATLSFADVPLAAGKFLAGLVPHPIPTLAAPGLSPHGQMRAIDFQIRQGDKTVAGPRSATISAQWDKAGWTKKLNVAVHAGSERFSGPLASPREPWHYTYSAQ